MRTRLLRQLSGFESRHLPKILNGRHKQRSGQHTLARQKNNTKKDDVEHVRYLGMLTGVENLAALLTAQAGGMPVETQRLTPFSCQVKTVITTQAENQNSVTIQFHSFACLSITLYMLYQSNSLYAYVSFLTAVCI